jgi:hypothetical protein
MEAGMKPMIAVAGAIVLSAALSTSLAAQWPDYPHAGVPRLPDGQPNLDAPVPRTADGKPDLSGLWRGGMAGQLAQPGQPAPAAATTAPDGTPLATFRDVGANIKGGLPLTPWGAEILRKRKADNSKDNPEAHCLPMGIVQFHTQGAPRKFYQTPAALVILYEASSGVRQIFTDGRPLPNTDPQPWWYGYSTGKWEGDTLVVQTNGFRDDGWLDIWGSPLTESGKVTERFRRTSFGRMEIDVTVDDPKAYTKPWTVRVNQQIMVDTEILEFICLENQRFTGQPKP